MKRTLFSCCIVLTALAIPLLPARLLPTASGWEAPSDSLDGVGHCAYPYTYADSYGECFWEDDDCDRVAEEAETGQVAELESVLVSDDVEPYDEEKTDYWYDGDSGSYYYYEFADDDQTVDAIIDQTVDATSDPLDELFETCETEATDAPTDSEQDVVTEEMVSEEAVTYGYEEEYDYYAEYEDYGYDFEEYEYRYGEDSDYAYESSDAVDWDQVVEESVSEPAAPEEAVCDEAVEAVVEDSWKDEYYSEYDNYYSEYDDCYWMDEEEVASTQDVVAAETPAEAVTETAEAVVESKEVVAETDEAVEAVAEDSWEDDYYSEYDNYYPEYDDCYWMDEEEVASTQDAVAAETPAEAVTETEEVVAETEEVVAETEEFVAQGAEPAEAVADQIEPWQYNEYDYGYDSDQYEYDYDSYEYDYEYWEETEVVAEPLTEEANLPIVADEPAVESNDTLPRAAALSLAHTLSRIGSTLQGISERITEMVDEEVAQQPNADTTER